LPVADVAWRVGYANAAKFARQFRRHTGINPSAWRSR
jgi:transcriptional regulator GlxA family with amidase domain